MSDTLPINLEVARSRRCSVARMRMGPDRHGVSTSFFKCVNDTANS